MRVTQRLRRVFQGVDEMRLFLHVQKGFQQVTRAQDTDVSGITSCRFCEVSFFQMIHLKQCLSRIVMFYVRCTFEAGSFNTHSLDGLAFVFIVRIRFCSGFGSSLKNSSHCASHRHATAVRTINFACSVQVLLLHHDLKSQEYRASKTCFPSF